MEKNFIEIAKNAKQASLKIAELSTEIKNSALSKIADFFEAHKTEIFEANKRDLEEAEKLVEINENYAYWYLGFKLANTKVMTYERKDYDSPKLFFKERMDISSMFSLASSLEANQLVYTWLQIQGSEKELNEYKAMVNLFDNKENELEEGKLNRITEKINKTK